MGKAALPSLHLWLERQIKAVSAALGGELAKPYCRARAVLPGPHPKAEQSLSATDLTLRLGLLQDYRRKNRSNAGPRFKPRDRGKAMAAQATLRGQG
jgi:hypothetical protein